MKGLLDAHPAVTVTDDRPFNEYFLVRWLRYGIPDPSRNKH